MGARLKRVGASTLAVAIAIFMVSFLVLHLAMLADARGRGRPLRSDSHHPPLRWSLRGAGLTAPWSHSRAPASTPMLELPPLGRMLFAPRFPARAQLVTNDFAYFNPRAAHAVRSPAWLVTSGSLFARAHDGWTGIPDSLAPNARSSAGTGSATFRVVTRRRDFATVGVSFDLLVQRFVSTPSNPMHDWDGVHVFLRYRSQRSLYVVTVTRRDGVIVAKKKQPGGLANGGTYYALGKAATYGPVLGRWERVLVTIGPASSGGVRISAYIDRRLLLDVADDGTGGNPLTRPGAVGIRGDNVEFEFTRFRVQALR